MRPAKTPELADSVSIAKDGTRRTVTHQHGLVCEHRSRSPGSRGKSHVRNACTSSAPELARSRRWRSQCLHMWGTAVGLSCRTFPLATFLIPLWCSSLASTALQPYQKVRGRHLLDSALSELHLLVGHLVRSTCLDQSQHRSSSAALYTSSSPARSVLYGIASFFPLKPYRK